MRVEESINKIADLNLSLMDISISVKKYGAKGDGTTDDTIAIQNTIDYVNSIGGGTVSIPNGNYKVSATNLVVSEHNYAIKLYSNVRIIMNKNTKISLVANNLVGYQIFKLSDINNVSIVGGQIIGDKLTHTGTTGEWGVGIKIMGCTNVYINVDSINNCWGDGIYIGSSLLQNYCKNVVVERFTMDNNRRQGISIVSAINLRISDGYISNTSGTAPSDGIDIEPNVNTEYLQNIIIENVTTENNSGSGIKLFMGFYADSLNNISINIKNHIDKNSQYGFRGREYIPNVKGFIKLENCKWENGLLSPFAVHNWSSTAPRIDVYDCIAYWTGTIINTVPAFDISMNGNTIGTNVIGNVHLYRPQIIVKNGCIAPQRGIFITPQNNTSSANISIIDPVELPISSVDSQVSIEKIIDNFTVSDKYGILKTTLTTVGLIMSNYRYKRTISNKGSVIPLAIYMPSVQVGQTITIINESGYLLKVYPSTGSGQLFYPLTVAEKYISSVTKGSRITLLGVTGGFTVLDMIGTWSVEA